MEYSRATGCLDLKVPLGRLARKLRKKDILLMVDGALAPGMIELDFSSDLRGVDF